MKLTSQINTAEGRSTALWLLACPEEEKRPSEALDALCMQADDNERVGGGWGGSDVGQSVEAALLCQAATQQRGRKMLCSNPNNGS